MEQISCYVNDKELTDFWCDNYPQLFEKYEITSSAVLKQVQVCYLYHIVGIARARIAEITGYAVSTVSTLRKKCMKWMDVARAIFTEVKQTVALKVDGIINQGKYKDVEIEYLPNFGRDNPGNQQVYLFKFYTDSRTVPVFSKIGTTTRSIGKRLKEEIAYYRKRGFAIKNVSVCKVVNCGNIPAEGYESFLRAFLIKEHPGTWHKNDRFFGVDISTNRFAELCSQFNSIK